MRFAIRHIIFFFILICVTSCGFHLRGSVPLSPPLQRLYIQIEDPYGKLAQNLHQYFKMTGIYLTNSAEDATTVLHITKEEKGQQLLSVGGTQETRQYNLTLTVTFQLQNSKGIVLIGNQSVIEARTLTIQSSQILGGSNEANTMYQQMRQAIVYDIVNRLSSQEVTNILTEANKKTL